VSAAADPVSGQTADEVEHAVAPAVDAHAQIEPAAPEFTAEARGDAPGEDTAFGQHETSAETTTDFTSETTGEALHEAGHRHTATETAEATDHSDAANADDAAPSADSSAPTDTKPPARTPWYARLGHGATPAPASADEAAHAEPVADEQIVAAPAPASPRDAEIDAIAEMRERVARARQAAEADDGAATLSPLTLIDVARPPSESVEDRFEELPAFLRERRRAPAWLRVLIVLLALLNLLALLGQAAYVYRAEIAAEFPALRAPLATACAALPDSLRCELGLPRHITSLRVVSADLQPVEGGNFNLVVALHNDDALPMAYPSLDVILSDAHTQVLIRRVIAADEYLGAHRDAADRRRVGLVGNAETTITVPMHIADEGVVGYTVGIFYP